MCDWRGIEISRERKKIYFINKKRERKRERVSELVSERDERENEAKIINKNVAGRFHAF